MAVPRGPERDDGQADRCRLVDTEPDGVDENRHREHGPAATHHPNRQTDDQAEAERADHRSGKPRRGLKRRGPERRRDRVPCVFNCMLV